MRMLQVSVVVALLALSAESAAAQSVTLEFQNGKVRLNAQNVSASLILAEWARRGQTKIVNGERVPGPPVTLQLEDVPEQQALDIVLRSASGYLVAPREAAIEGASSFAGVYILPTSSRPVTTSAALPPSQAPQPVVEDVDDDGPPPQTPRVVPNPGARIPRDVITEPAFVNGGFVNGRPVNENQNPEQPTPPPATTPGNPFVTPGTARPGVVTPGPQNNSTRPPNP